MSMDLSVLVDQKERIIAYIHLQHCPGDCETDRRGGL